MAAFHGSPKLGHFHIFDQLSPPKKLRQGLPGAAAGKMWEITETPKDREQYGHGFSLEDEDEDDDVDDDDVDDDDDDVSSFNYWTKINPFTCQTRVFTQETLL